MGMCIFRRCCYCRKKKNNDLVNRKHNFFFVTQNNFSEKYKNKIISNISMGILIFISIFKGFSANHI